MVWYLVKLWDISAFNLTKFNNNLSRVLFRSTRIDQDCEAALKERAIF
jgi:hypothetical protein